MQTSNSPLPLGIPLVAVRRAPSVPATRASYSQPVVLRLEACAGGGRWLLSQVDGQSLIATPQQFRSPAAAVKYAKDQCGDTGCSFVIRTACRQTAAVA